MYKTTVKCAIKAMMDCAAFVGIFLLGQFLDHIHRV